MQIRIKWLVKPHVGKILGAFCGGLATDVWSLVLISVIFSLSGMQMELVWDLIILCDVDL